MSKKEKNHGLILDVITPDNYIFGGEASIEQKAIQLNGDWSNFLPEDELQKRNGLETNNCVAFATLNGIEILMNRLFGLLENYSERFVGILAQSGNGGNSPQKVCETIRYISGLIPEKDLPFGDSIKTLQDYYSPNPIPRKLIEKGREWINKFDFKHEWVFLPGEKYKQELMLKALEYSPLGASVYAWNFDEDTELYFKEDERDNHWVTIYHAEPGLFWSIFDHYDNTHKRLKWNTDFLLAKKYSLTKRKSGFFNFFCL